MRNKNNGKLALSEIIIKNVSFINKLAKLKSVKRRCALINGATSEELLAVVEIALNILHAREPFWTRGQLAKLTASAHLIRKLARVRSPDSARKLLVYDEIGRNNNNIGQHGCGVPFVALAGVLSSVLLPYIAERIFETHK